VGLIPHNQCPQERTLGYRHTHRGEDRKTQNTCGGVSGAAAAEEHLRLRRSVMGLEQVLPPSQQEQPSPHLDLRLEPPDCASLNFCGLSCPAGGALLLRSNTRHRRKGGEDGPSDRLDTKPQEWS
jgi:hypothetical protein